MYGLQEEIEYLKGKVARQFPIYDVRVSFDHVSFFCRIDESTLEEKFDILRKELIKEKYVPILTYEGGEHVIHVMKRPRVKYRSIYVNVALLIITVFTTIFAGATSWGGYMNIPVLSLESISKGLIFFAIPIMLILGIHELGHYFMAKRHGVAASLPFFIPSFPPLGTFGAVISLREPIPNRKALLDIGIAGPIAGLAVALPVTALGLWLTNLFAVALPQNLAPGEVMLGVGNPLLIRIMAQFIPISGDYIMHPTLFAGLVGILVTAFNLLPAGQLDGGHIARALLGRHARWASYGAIISLLIMSFLFYFGWLIIAFVIIFLGGVNHPPPLNDITKLDKKRKVLGIFIAVVLVLSFHPVPLEQTLPTADFQFSQDVQGTLDNGTVLTNDTVFQNITGTNIIYTFFVVNTGNTLGNITVTRGTGNLENYGWNVTLIANGTDNPTSSLDLEINSTENVSIDLIIYVPNGANGTFDITVRGTMHLSAWKVDDIERSFALDIVVG